MDYDPDAIQRFADRLYRSARVALVLSTILGLELGLLFGYLAYAARSSQLDGGRSEGIHAVGEEVSVGRAEKTAAIRGQGRRGQSASDRAERRHSPNHRAGASSEGDDPPESEVVGKGSAGGGVAAFVWPIFCVLFCTASGFLIGEARGFSLRIRAQSLLCQKKIEANTGPQTYYRQIQQVLLAAESETKPATSPAPPSPPAPWDNG